MQCPPQSQLVPFRIDSTEIRQDAAGRFCLNDLHRASGGAGHHQPAKFFENGSTRDLCEEITRNSPNSESLPVETRMGRNEGTYVCKEIVYAYAMWISPAFHLKVIRTFDATVTGQHQPPQATSQAPALPGPLEDKSNVVLGIVREWLSRPGFDAGLVWAHALQTITSATGVPTDPLARALPAASGPVARLNPTELGQRVGLAAAEVNKRLEQRGLQRAILDGTKKAWELTEAGAEYGSMVPYSGRNGHTKHRPLWEESVLALLRESPTKAA